MNIPTRYKDCIIIIFTVSAIQQIAAQNDDKIHLNNITALTFRKEKITTNKRSTSGPQIRCTGGTASCAFVPDIVQCVNKGFDGRQVSWECHATMDKAYSLRSTNVACEGYSQPGDVYVLQGSCYVKLVIDYNKPQRRGGGTHRLPKNIPPHIMPASTQQNSPIATLLSGIITLVLFFSCCMLCAACLGGPGYSHHGYAPLPPMIPGGPMMMGAAPPYGGWGGYPGGGYYHHGSGGVGPGFLGGAATGGLLGYLFGQQNHGGWGGHGGWEGHGSYGQGWGHGWDYPAGGGHSTAESVEAPPTMDAVGHAMAGDIQDAVGYGGTDVE